MAGLGGVFYAGQERGGIGAPCADTSSSLTLLLFVAIWGHPHAERRSPGWHLPAAALPVLQTHLPTSLADLTGLAAGIGIVLLARSPDGILGMA